jgi:hypothetical protein
MNLAECINIYRTLGDVADKNLGMRNNYNVALNLQTLEEVIKPFDKLRNDMVEKLKKKHGEKEIPEKEVEKFNSELAKVLEEEHKLDLKKIKVDDIPDDTELTAGFFVGIKSIVTS